MKTFQYLLIFVLWAICQIAIGQPEDFYARGIPNEQAEQFYMHGIISEQAGELMEALYYYDQALQLDAFHDQARFNHALVLFKLEEYEAARKATDALIQKMNLDIEVYELRALSLSQLGEYEAAIKDFDQVLSIKEKPESRINRGLAYLETGQYENALNDFEYILQSHPDHALAYAYQAEVYMELEAYDLALDAYNLSVYYDDTDVMTLNNRAHLFLQMGHPIEGLEDFEQALSIEPCTPLFMNMIDYYKNADDFSIAKQYALAGMHYDDEDAAFYYQIGQIELQEQNAAAAIRSFTVAIDLEPHNLEFRLDRAMAASFDNDWQQVITDCDFILANDPEHIMGQQLRMEAAGKVQKEEYTNFEAPAFFEADSYEQFPLSETVETEKIFEEDPYGGF